MKGVDLSAEEEEPTLFPLPFRGETLEVWSDTSPGQLAMIAHLSLADPRLDAFYRAAGVTLKDPEGKVVFPPPHLRKVPDGPEQQDRREEDTEAHPGAGEGTPDRVASLEPEGGDSPMADAQGVGPPSGDEAAGPEEATSGGDLFDLFG